ncbi:38926_t:CDS:2 [Gigaspora margarita]|uniref:38926_t:CDS:1 n=1 Tax=Gigaspora margarita TaxID=4874 RepID=A0ABN7U9W2_GIGMA|nr:38926_t:CDS:2 [Gigaspora margarita]
MSLFSLVKMDKQKRTYTPEQIAIKNENKNELSPTCQLTDDLKKFLCVVTDLNNKYCPTCKVSFPSVILNIKRILALDVVETNRFQKVFERE